jgi:alpha-tubulin N-acetyltransferase 1
MLKFENIIPSNLAYDRPSPKLIAFLKKHYSLVNFTPQNNNFVVFHEYFSNVNFIFIL